MSANSRSRRDFLKGTVALAPLAAVSAFHEAGAQQAPDHDDLQLSAPAAAQPAEPNYRPAFFNATEWAFVTAACNRLIPDDDLGPGAAALGVPQYIDRQMQTSYGDAGHWYMHGPFVSAKPEFGYQSKLTPKEQYRIGIREIQAYCSRSLGKPFEDLSEAQQDSVLKGIESNTIKSDELPLATFFSSFLLKNTMEGFFGDPMYGGNKDMAAWKMIAYPGVRADYQDWVDKYGRKYPYGPVSIHGQRG